MSKEKEGKTEICDRIRNEDKSTDGYVFQRYILFCTANLKLIFFNEGFNWLLPSHVCK